MITLKTTKKYNLVELAFILASQGNFSKAIEVAKIEKDFEELIIEQIMLVIQNFNSLNITYALNSINEITDINIRNRVFSEVCKKCKTHETDRALYEDLYKIKTELKVLTMK